MLTVPRIFKAEGNPIAFDEDLQVLLKQIYTQEEFETYYQGVGEKFMSLHSFEEWMNLTLVEKRATRIIIGGKEKGLIALATLLGTGGKPVDDDNDMQNLLQKIYSPKEFERYFHSIKQKVRALYSLDEWMNLSGIEKGAVKIMIGGKEKGLKALANASLFNVGGNPVNNSTDFKNLIIKIYGLEEVEKYSHLLKTKTRSKK